jgi:hypothetical protein
MGIALYEKAKEICLPARSEGGDADTITQAVVKWLGARPEVHTQPASQGVGTALRML